MNNYRRVRLIEQIAPFILFFDQEMLQKLKEKYKTDWRGGHIHLFVASMMEYKGKVNFMDESDLEEWNKKIGELDRDKLRFAKDMARVTFLGPVGAIHLPMDFISGMEFVDFQTVVLIFNFLTGTFIKKVFVGAMSFPTTTEGTKGVREYFKNLVMGTSADPISEENWRSIEKIRKRIAQNAPNVKGLEENLWKTML